MPRVQLHRSDPEPARQLPIMTFAAEIARGRSDCFGSHDFERRKQAIERACCARLAMSRFDAVNAWNLPDVCPNLRTGCAKCSAVKFEQFFQLPSAPDCRRPRAAAITAVHVRPTATQRLGCRCLMSPSKASGRYARQSNSMLRALCPSMVGNPRMVAGGLSIDQE